MGYAYPSFGTPATGPNEIVYSVYIAALEMRARCLEMSVDDAVGDSMHTAFAE